MLRKLRPRSVYDVMAAIACLAALAGGTAYAANEWTGANIVDESLTGADVLNNTLASTDITNESLTGTDVANSGLGSADIASESLTSVNVQNGTLRGDDIQNGSIFGEDVRNDSLGGFEINEATLQLALEASADFDAVCDPTTAAFLDCDADPTITVSRNMPVLVTAVTHFASTGSTSGASARGTCRLERNDAAVSTDHPIGERTDNTDASNAQQAGMQITDVQNLAIGTWRFEVSCKQTDPNIEFRNVHISVVELGLD